MTRELTLVDAQHLMAKHNVPGVWQFDVTADFLAGPRPAQFAVRCKHLAGQPPTLQGMAMADVTGELLADPDGVGIVVAMLQRAVHNREKAWQL